MFLASSNCCPTTPVLPTFSDPAKSTKYNLLCFVESFFVFFCATWMIKSEWLRDDLSFIPVNATFLFCAPLFITFSICSGDPTGISVQFCINTPFILSSLIYNLAFEAVLYQKYDQANRTVSHCIFRHMNNESQILCFSHSV